MTTKEKDGGVLQLMKDSRKYNYCNTRKNKSYKSRNKTPERRMIESRRTLEK